MRDLTAACGFADTNAKPQAVNLEWHWLTCEYPPRRGGVSDYSHLVVEALAKEGDAVHVWCPPSDGETPPVEGVQVHRVCGRFGIHDLRRLGQALERFPPPRRLLVQWVPQGYGWRSLNLAFCMWLWRRACRRERILLMVHEPFVGFDEGGWKPKVVAVVQRLMTMIVLRAARQVAVSIPAWEACWRPWALGRRVPFTWLPIPSTVPVVNDPAGVAALRERLASDGTVIGHFGTYGRYIADLLTPLVPALLTRMPHCTLLLLGHGSRGFREQLAARHPEVAHRVQAVEGLDGAALSRHLQACDVMVQPYPDGVSSRRTTAMAALCHGLPLVTTRGRLTEPIWAQHQAALLVPANEAAAQVDATCRLLDDAAARHTLGEAARLLYVERFALEHTVAALRRLMAEDES